MFLNTKNGLQKYNQGKITNNISKNASTKEEILHFYIRWI